MQALRLIKWGEPPAPVQVERPVPHGSEVLLRVEAAGLCHSDLHLAEAPEGAFPTNFRSPSATRSPGASQRSERAPRE